MHLSIRTGFRFRTSSLDEAFLSIQAFRHALRPRALQARRQALAVIAVSIIDDCDHRARPRQTAAPILAEALTVFLERIWGVESGQRRDPSVDFRCELGLFPFEGRLYGAIRTEQPEFRALWMAQPGVEDFAYAADDAAPVNVSADAWVQRRRIWRTLWDADNQLIDPAFAGFIAHCVGPYVEHPDAAAVVAEAPPPEVRARRVAQGLLLDRWMREHYPPPQKKRTTSTAEAEARTWLQTSEGQQALAKEMGDVLPKLRLPITIKDMTRT